MHEPADSFKSKIASYREWLATNPPDDAHYQFVLGILDRWERHPDVEAIWDKIKPTLPPEIFILAILKTGRVAAKIDRLAHELPREAKPISRIERFLTERQLGQGNRFLAWLGDLRQGQERLLSRNTETAARTQFMVTLRDYFAVQCGQSLDDVVATLTNIVLDLKPKGIGLPRERTEVTADHVRDAAKAAREDPSN